jgi:hypothetical protein
LTAAVPYPVSSDACRAAGGLSAGGGADTMTYDYSGTLSGALTADGKAVDL